MKKILILGLVILFGSSVLAAGPMHAVAIEVFYSDGITHPDFDTELNSVVVTNLNSGDVLTGPPWIPSIVYYDNANHIVVYQAGTFPTTWQAGDVVTVWVQCTSTTFGTESSTHTHVLNTENFQAFMGTEGLTLPVELSAFTATFMDTYTLISWTTASETDVLGFNIYRNDIDEYETSVPLNAELIPGQGSTTVPHNYEFQDIAQLDFETTYYYWLESVDYGGESNVYGSIAYTPEEGQGGYEDDFETNLLMNQPNPFSGTTTIKYAIKGMLKTEPVNIRIYNTLGQLVNEITAQNGEFEFDASNLPTGIYFYQIKTENFNEIKKMMVIR